MRKGKGILYNMPLEQQAALERWLFDDFPRLTYVQAVKRLAEECKVETSIRAVCVYFQRRLKGRMLSRINDSRPTTRAVAEQAKEHRGEAFEALMEISGRAAFELHSAQPEEVSLTELKDLVTMATQGLRVRNETEEVEIKRRGIDLREKRYEEMMTLKRTPISKGAVTKETLLMIEEKAKIC